MAALTAERDTPKKLPGINSYKMSASKVWKGSLVCLNASGYATKGAVATTLKHAGRAMETVDNSGGAAGDKSINVEPGVFRWGNSASGDLITIADIGNNAYIVDDQTVAKTDGSSTRSIAGPIVDVDALGVWVRSGI